MITVSSKQLWMVLLVSFLMPGVAWGQATAQISGVVTDQTGAVIPGVGVTVTQTEIGFERAAVSNEAGSFVLSSLPIGPYRFESSLPGFQTYVQTGTLQVNDTVVINVILQVGQAEQVVEVQASALQVETRTVGISNLMDNERLLELPLNGRNAAELIAFTGSAVETGRTGSRSLRGGDPTLALAGGIITGTGYTLDGAMYTNPWDWQVLPLPFPDALQEFKVETSGLTARSGKGAQVSAVTKSGTNEFHGSLFEYVRNDLLNARSYFASGNSSLKRNQFGGTVGGPVVRDKVFFFAGYQQTITRSDPADRSDTIITPAMLAGDFTAIVSPACNGGQQITLGAPFVNNTIDPSLFSSASVIVANQLLSEQETPPDDCGDVRYGRRNVFDENSLVGRVDYEVSDDHSLFGRVSYNWYKEKLASSFNNNLLNAASDGSDNLSQSYAFGSTYLIGDSMVNTLRFAGNWGDILRTSPQTFDPTDLGINAVSNVPGVITMAVDGGFEIGRNFLVGNLRYDTRSIMISDDLSLIRGAHQFAFGGELMHGITDSFQATFAAPTFEFDGAQTGLGMADFMLGLPFRLTQGAAAPSFQTQWYPAAYANDTWSVTPNFTVNLGVRWQPSLPWVSKAGTHYNFDIDRFRDGVKSTVFLNAPAGLYYPGDPGFPDPSGVEKRWNLLAPRVGWAWDVLGDGTTSIRSSIGLSHEERSQGSYVGTFGASPFFNRLSTFSFPDGWEDPWTGTPGGNPFPLQIDQDAPFVPNGDYLSRPYNDRQASAWAWNLTVQRELPGDFLVTASYEGSQTLYMRAIKPLNPAVYFPGDADANGNCFAEGHTFNAGSPGVTCSTTDNTNERRILFLERPADGVFLGRVAEYDSGGVQNYNGLRLTLARRIAGSSFNVNYNFSKCLGDVPVEGLQDVGEGHVDPNNRALDRGNCEGSRRHVFNFTGVVEAPDLAGSSDTVRAIATGWSLSGIYRYSSGAYLEITNGRDRALNGSDDQRPDQVIGVDVTGESGPRDQYLNPAAFAQPALGTFGTLGRNSVVGVPLWQFDVALARRFSLTESQSLEVRAEAYNLTNSFRPSFPGRGQTRITSGSFGVIRDSLSPRIMQFALKYVF